MTTPSTVFAPHTAFQDEDDAKAWARSRTWRAAWAECPRADWMLAAALRAGVDAARVLDTAHTLVHRAVRALPADVARTARTLLTLRGSPTASVEFQRFATWSPDDHGVGGSRKAALAARDAVVVFVAGSVPQARGETRARAAERLRLTVHLAVNSAAEALAAAGLPELEGSGFVAFFRRLATVQRSQADFVRRAIPVTVLVRAASTSTKRRPSKRPRVRLKRRGA